MCTSNELRLPKADTLTSETAETARLCMLVQIWIRSVHSLSYVSVIGDAGTCLPTSLLSR